MTEPDDTQPSSRELPVEGVAPSTLMPSRLGKYELLLPIGRGGTATVYLARAAMLDDLHRDFAVKLLHSQYASDAGRMLLDEARLAGRVRHPNVVPVVEVGNDEHGTYLVMEYIEGDTLASLLSAARSSGRPIPRSVVARILLDMLAGLHAAHELTGVDGEPLHVVHRDVSPQNVLVGIDGVSRLTDFGIARAVGRAATTSEGLLKGKAAYMSPEQALGQPLDRRCDVWAAGVIAWELLANRRMHASGDNASTLLRVVMQRPPPLRSVVPGLPVSVEQAVAAALEPRVEDRPPTAAAFRARLLAAWTDDSKVADAEEVAEYVGAATRARREHRRAEVAQVLAARDTSILHAAATTPDEPTDQITIPLDAVQPTVPPTPPRARAPKRLLFVGAATIVIAVGAYAARARDPGAARPPEAVAAEAVPSATASAPPRTVHLRGRVPIVKVLLGNRLILELAQPALASDVMIPSGPHPLTVFAADGRSATIPITDATTAYELPLEPLPAAATSKVTTSKRPVTHKKPHGAATSDPALDLAPPPYGKP